MQRESIQFLSNVPVPVALKYADGKFVDGIYGQRVMYTTTEDKVMFLDPDVAAKINALEVAPGEEFLICKQRPNGKGAKTIWKVWRPEDQRVPATIEGESSIERDLRHSLNSNGHGVLVVPRVVESNGAAQSVKPTAPSLDADGRKENPPAPVNQPASPSQAPTTPTIRYQNAIPTGWAQSLLRTTNDLVDVYAAACRHAESQGVAPAVVRTLLLSAFINVSKTRGSHAA
jgi:hypothetical protein